MTDAVRRALAGFRLAGLGLGALDPVAVDVMVAETIVRLIAHVTVDVLLLRAAFALVLIVVAVVLETHLLAAAQLAAAVKQMPLGVG